MRVGPFSQKHTVDFIHSHFVPYFLSNEAYNAGKHGSKERELLRAIRRNAKSKGMRAGSVQVYLLTPDAEVVDVLTVSEAAKARTLITFLQKNVEQHKVKGGARVIPAGSSPTAVKATASQLSVRVAAQYKPRLKIMVEDWITLNSDEWRTFLPPSSGATAWTIDEQVTRKLLVRLYPYALNWNHDFDQIEEAQLNAKIVKQSNKETVVALRGKLKMTHMLNVRSGKQQVVADLSGIAILRPNQKPELTIITEKARFGSREFEALVQSVAGDGSP